MTRSAFCKEAKGFWLALVLFVVVGCAQKIEPPAQRLDLTPLTFQQLDGWQDDQQAEALSAFLKSCAVLDKKEDSVTWSLPQAGKAGDWKSICDEARTQRPATDLAARAFFETYFIPYAVQNQGEGLFTGYYEAQLHGAWQRGGKYQTPLWSRPDDMLSLDLGDFRDSLKGQKITGKIAGQKFVPYDDRALIARGSLANRAKPLCWIDDPIGAFFLEIQGSGQVQFQDGSIVRVGYAAQNGHGYTPVGRVLLDRGELERPITMQKIRAWLTQHPDRAQEIMDTNPSVVFFQKSDKKGAVGAQGVELTPMRSLAVDKSFVPLGVPLWLLTPEHKQLVVAQDTGGAIKGPVRGDLFWGAGAHAEEGAGQMQNVGTYMLLLPKAEAHP